MDAKIRMMIRVDMPEVLEIESHGPKPHWDEEEFKAILKDRKTIARVASVGSGNSPPVVGFIVYAMSGNAMTVLNLCVHEDHRRCGYGRQMLQVVIDRMAQTLRKNVLLTVHEKNVAAQRFLRACGFQSDRVERGVYDDGESDGYRFALRAVDRALFKNRIASIK